MEAVKFIVTGKSPIETHGHEPNLVVTSNIIGAASVVVVAARRRVKEGFRDVEIIEKYPESAETMPQNPRVPG